MTRKQEQVGTVTVTKISCLVEISYSMPNNSKTFHLFQGLGVFFRNYFQGLQIAVMKLKHILG